MIKFAVLLVVLAALCGCSESAKQRALEKRLAALEERAANLRQDFKELAAVCVETLNTNAGTFQRTFNSVGEAQVRVNELTAERLTLQDQRLAGLPELVRAEISEELKRRLASAKQPGQAAPARAAARPAAEAAREGVPLSVYNQIAADAAKLLPGQYGLQEVQIKMEIEAFRKLHPSR